MGDRVALRGDVAGTGAVAIDVTVPPGSGVPPHRHASAETFRVLSGRLTVARAAAGGAFEEMRRDLAT